MMYEYVSIGRKRKGEDMEIWAPTKRCSCLGEKEFKKRVCL